MLAALMIVFREMLEAGLIIGIVLAATKGIHQRGLWVTSGVLAGIAGACLLALFANTISEAMAGTGQELFNSFVLISAVIMLAWHNIWMARHGRHMAAEMKQIGYDVSTGHKSLLALAIVIAVAVLREGSEVVLFLYGIAISAEDTFASMMLGGFIGLVLGGVLSVMMYLGLLRIPVKHLFTVTSWMITLLAAGMASQAVSYLQQGGYITILGNTVWDTSSILSEKTLFGQALHILVGYSDQPSQMQLVVYCVTITVIVTLMKKLGRTPLQEKTTFVSSV